MFNKLNFFGVISVGLLSFVLFIYLLFLGNLATKCLFISGSLSLQFLGIGILVAIFLGLWLWVKSMHYILKILEHTTSGKS